MTAQEAVRGEAYWCIECSDRVVRRAGSKIPHFAHHRPTGECRLRGESWLHIAAKYAVAGAVHAWFEKRASAPAIVRGCSACGASLAQSLPPRVRGVGIEFPIPSRSVIADVVLLDEDGAVCLVVEIKATHAVDAEKRVRLRGVPFIELDASDALQNPHQWRTIQNEGLRPWTCNCVRARNATARIVDAWIRGQGPPPSIEIECPICSKKQIVGPPPETSAVQQDWEIAGEGRSHDLALLDRSMNPVLLADIAWASGAGTAGYPSFRERLLLCGTTLLSAPNEWKAPTWTANYFRCGACERSQGITRDYEETETDEEKEPKESQDALEIRETKLPGPRKLRVYLKYNNYRVLGCPLPWAPGTPGRTEDGFLEKCQQCKHHIDSRIWIEKGTISHLVPRVGRVTCDYPRVPE